jgi:hypothetical protein
MKYIATVNFKKIISCTKECLNDFPIKISGVSGTLMMPRLPNPFVETDDRNYPPLISPRPNINFQMYDAPIDWGDVFQFPEGESTVKSAIIEFSDIHDPEKAKSQQIYKDFGLWVDLVEQYVSLQTKQNAYRRFSIKSNYNGVNIYSSTQDSFERIQDNSHPSFAISIGGNDELLQKTQFEFALNCASNRLPLKQEYNMLLDAYNANAKGDYRKALIDAASAVEIGLTSRIVSEFRNQGISFGTNLLKKFQMLSGRLELLKIVGVSIPDRNYQNNIIEPRNKAIHKGAFPTEEETRTALKEASQLLTFLSSEINEQTPA